MPEVPIVGVGGVLTGHDAFELVLAGASAISVGTASFHDPSAAIRIKRELEQILISKGFASFHDAVGYAHRKES